MSNAPYSDRLMNRFKSGIVGAIGVFIGLVVAQHVTNVWYWRGAIFLGVVAVYWLIVWLLQLA
jgi:hypothetical protein